jgi:ABC-type Na+ transport system ATPase subunit NatA
LLAEKERRPLTVIFSSHITGDLRRFCSHFCVLEAGKIESDDAAIAQWMR